MLRRYDVHTVSDLQEAYRSIAKSDFIVLDTEFMRERTYFPQLCLIQIGTDEGIWLLDPLMPYFDWEGLRTLLGCPSVLKIMHAPQQDFEALAVHDVSFTGLFWDTQVASMLCGDMQSLGYEALVSYHLGIPVDKGEQRSAWHRRPLTESQRLYAAQDVAYLKALVDILKTQMQMNNRLEWFQEDMDFLIRKPLYGMQKVFGLKPQWVQDEPVLFAFYSVVQRLFEWRENLAQRHDQPREFIWNNQDLMNVAEWWVMRAHPAPEMPDIASRRLRAAWPEVLTLLQDIPSVENGSVSIKTRISRHAREDVVRRLRRLLHECAQDLNIPVALIATRDELKRFAYGEQDVRFTTGWRYDVFGSTACSTG